MSEQLRGTCARCGRSFRVKKEGPKYGPTCARKLRGQTELDSQSLVSGQVLQKKKKRCDIIEVRDAQGEISAVIV